MARIAGGFFFFLATTAQAQLFNFQTVTVPASDAQPGGPAYDYEVAVTEVTNAQYMAFLNDAEFHNEEQNPGLGNERGANLKFRQPPFGGDVGLIIGDGGDVDAVFDLLRADLWVRPVLAARAAVSQPSS